MLGSHPISAVIGAPITATSPTPAIRSYLKGLTDTGLHVMLCKPGTKEPIDLRSKKQIEDDNAAYHEHVRELWTAIGREFTEDDLLRLEAPGGFHLATNDTARLRTYVNKFRKAYGDGTEDKSGTFRPIAPVSLAVSVGPSKLLVVDCDTTDERLAFGAWMAEQSGRPEMAFTAPTVLSPGVFRNGEWVHRDGGHFYFAVGDVELPKSTGTMIVQHKGVSFDVFWSDRYILIPPSERTEGKYERVGPVLSLEENLWMVAAIDRYMEERAAKQRSDDAESLPPEVREGLIEWYANTSWASLLEPHGWERTGDDRACGCEQWGRPGRSSDKSATAHIPGCARMEYMDSPDPPIHFWTRFPGGEIEDMIENIGKSTLSKLQLMAALDHGGEVSLAMNSISELPEMKRVTTTTITLPGIEMEVGMSTGMAVFVAEGEEDGEIDAPNMEPVAPAYVPTAQVPATPAAMHTPPAVMPFPAAIPPDTAAPSPAPAPAHMGVVFGMSGSVEENLVGPAGSNITSAPQFSPGNATPNGMSTATTPATGVATGFATQNATVTSTPRYEPSYTNPAPSSPWDSPDDSQNTKQIVEDTIREMTPIITASVVQSLKESGVIP